ncbi:glycosyltransferase family 39 protein, partial [bacterium]|nr:glycosyltransferase family 39 protein [candidate division CSSED10-310 bacterium]
MMGNARSQLWKRWLLPALIVCVAGGLRMARLDRMALWGDEACMVYLCQETPENIVAALASADRPDVDVAPPLYFLVLHVWMKWFGTSVAAVRGLSALFSLLTVVCVMGLTRRLFTRNIALAAGILTTISPFQIWYAQECRMYAMATCLAAAAIWALAAAVTPPRPTTAWILFFVMGLTLLYTQ